MATGICQLLLPRADALKSCCELILRHQTRAQPQQLTHTHARTHACAAPALHFSPSARVLIIKLKITTCSDAAFNTHFGSSIFARTFVDVVQPSS